SEDTCVSGKCLYFDGSNDFVEIDGADDNKLELTTEMSVSAWIKPTSLPTGQGSVVMSNYNFNSGSSHGFQFGDNWDETDKFVFTLYKTSGSTQNSVVTVNDFFTQNLNRWTHVEGVFKAGEYVRIFVNG